jgi:cell wall-associated NlpC family hydrolase
VYPQYQRPGGARLARRLAVLALAAAAAGAGTAAVLAAVIGGAAGRGTAAAAVIAYAASTQSGCVAPAAAQGAWRQWSATQVTNAATVTRTGQADRVPVYGQVIAVATAMQESSLVNLDHGDRDSLGLFQQRPSQGWGTPAQIMDPVYASGQFYARLLAVPGWQDLPLTVAAQDVQHSATPGAYARWQAAAVALVGHVTGGGGSAVPGGGQSAGPCGPGTVPAGTPAKVAAVITWAEDQEGTLYDYGGSCTSPHSPDMALHCDCSSLVQQAFAHGAGISLPRTAEQQWEYGEAGHAQVIPLSQERPGDVVYFPSYLGPDVIGHTGIVVDPAAMKMINAPETGKPIGFASYNPAGLPYGSHLLTILRFINTGSTS